MRRNPVCGKVEIPFFSFFLFSFYISLAFRRRNGADELRLLRTSCSWLGLGAGRAASRGARDTRTGSERTFYSCERDTRCNRAREASLRRLRRVPLEYCQRKRRRKQGVKGEEEVESKTGEGLRRSETYAIYFFAINPQHNLLRPRGSEEKCSKWDWAKSFLSSLSVIEVIW